MRRAAAPALRALAVAQVGQVMIERADEEIAEAALGRVGGGGGVGPEKVEQESLGEVPGLFERVAALAEDEKDRLPVVAADLLPGPTRVARLAPPAGDGWRAIRSRGRCRLRGAVGVIFRGGSRGRFHRPRMGWQAGKSGEPRG